MIFRTESLSAGGADALAAKIVKTLVRAMAATFAGLRGRKRRHCAEIVTLSDHALRDIGLEPGGHAGPVAYDLLDLVPRGAYFSHRTQRCL